MILDDAKLQKAIGFTPHDGQKEVLASASRDLAICAGVRWGKTMLAGYMVLRELMREGKQAWIVAPTYELGRKTMDYIEGWLGVLYPERIKEWLSSRPVPRIRTDWGSWVEVKSATEPTSLLGEELDLIVKDESSRISKKIHEQYLIPRIASRQGRTVDISTPFGKNYFYRRWLTLKDENGAFHFESRDNPYFPPTEWERAKKLLPEAAFNQEYRASFLEDAATVFKNVERIVKDISIRDAVRGERYVMGVDLAKRKDWTVVSVMDADKFELVYWERFGRMDWAIQIPKIVSVAKRYNARTIIDSTGIGDPVSEQIRIEGVLVEDFYILNKSKTKLIEKLQLFIDQAKIRIPPIEVLVDELKAFGYKLSDAANVQFGAPEGFHDDCVISLALAVWGLQGEPSFLNPIQQELRKTSRRAVSTSYV